MYYLATKTWRKWPPPFLTNFRITEKLSKTSLYSLVRNKPELNVFIPSDTSGFAIERDYLLSVSILFNNF